MSASFLLMKACYVIEAAADGLAAESIGRRALSFGEYLGRMCMKLYLIHCFDFNFSWASIDLPLFGSTAITAAFARIVFDILVLLLFDLL